MPHLPPCHSRTPPQCVERFVTAGNHTPSLSKCGEGVFMRDLRRPFRDGGIHGRTLPHRLQRTSTNWLRQSFPDPCGLLSHPLFYFFVFRFLFRRLPACPRLPRFHWLAIETNCCSIYSRGVFYFTGVSCCRGMQTMVHCGEAITGARHTAYEQDGKQEQSQLLRFAF